MTNADWANKDFYKVLGIAKDASAADIKKAYRKLARANHPDSHPGDKVAEERFKVIAEAYDVVGNPEKRKKYDELRSVVTGLPVAGFTGSLTDRMDEGPPAGLGRVRAKTGTLTAVSTLAGVATGLDGVPMVFVLMVDQVRLVNTTKAKVTLDSAAAALGACRCGA